MLCLLAVLELLVLQEGHLVEELASPRGQAAQLEAGEEVEVADLRPLARVPLGQAAQGLKHLVQQGRLQSLQNLSIGDIVHNIPSKHTCLFLFIFLTLHLLDAWMEEYWSWRKHYPPIGKRLLSSGSGRIEALAGGNRGTTIRIRPWREGDIRKLAHG